MTNDQNIFFIQQSTINSLYNEELRPTCLQFQTVVCFWYLFVFMRVFRTSITGVDYGRSGSV